MNPDVAASSSDALLQDQLEAAYSRRDSFRDEAESIAMVSQVGLSSVLGGMLGGCLTMGTVAMALKVAEVASSTSVVHQMLSQPFALPVVVGVVAAGVVAGGVGIGRVAAEDRRERANSAHQENDVVAHLEALALTKPDLAERLQQRRAAAQDRGAAIESQRLGQRAPRA